MNSRVLNALAVAAMALPISGQAENFDYSFVDFAVIPEVDTDALDTDGDGFQLRGSLTVHENFFALVEIQDLEFDRGVDFTRWNIGAGGHWPINQRMDLVARAGLVRYDVDYRGGDEDDVGFFLGGRVRAQIMPRVELEGGIELSTAEVPGFEDEFSLVGEGRYHFNDQWSAGGLLSIGDDVSQLGVYGRFDF